jgi:hypothetical protein
MPTKVQKQKEQFKKRLQKAKERSLKNRIQEEDEEPNNNYLDQVLKRINRMQEEIEQGKQLIADLGFDPNKKYNIKKKIPIEEIRKHLALLSLKQIKQIARMSNLHTKIKLSSPRNELVDAIVKLYEYENGKYKSKNFTLDI